MPKKVACLAIHGMGDTQPTFADKLENKLAKKLGNQWSNVYFDTVYYAQVFQEHQNKLFSRVKAYDDIDWIALRKFMLFGFSDAAGFLRKCDEQGSPYEQVQEIILDAIDRAYDEVGPDAAIVIIAQSLGCNVISNFIWDAQALEPKFGAWRYAGFDDSPPGSALDKIRRLKQLKLLYFTGCNIPIFVAGIPQAKIKAISSNSKGYAFKWKNFYDPDDPLGWPLKNLTTRDAKESYRREVNEDIVVNSGNIFRNWNPLSHTSYWGDNNVVNPLVEDMRRLIA